MASTQSYLKNNQDGELLNRLYQEDYYWYLESAPFINKFGRAIAAWVQELGDSVLDLGCGTGWLAGLLPGEYSYVGLDGSQVAIERARKKYPKRKFINYRIERLVELGNTLPGIDKFDTLVLGGMLETLVEPTMRITLIQELQQIFSARSLIVYDLERLDTTQFNNRWIRLGEEHGTITVEELPDLVGAKRRRKIVVYDLLN